MKRLKEFLMTVRGMSESEADSSIEESKRLLESGECPEEVLVEMYGSDVQDLVSILGGT